MAVSLLDLEALIYKANAHPPNLECYTSDVAWNLSVMDESCWKTQSVWLQISPWFANVAHVCWVSKICGLACWSLLLFQCHMLMTEMPQVTTFLLRGCIDNRYIFAGRLGGGRWWVLLKVWEGELGTGCGTPFHSHWALQPSQLPRPVSFLSPALEQPPSSCAWGGGWGGVRWAEVEKYLHGALRGTPYRPNHTFADNLLC